jgi:hypothetical protein
VRALAFVIAVLAPLAASAGEFELHARAGAVFPFYEETFEFDPGGLPNLPGGIEVTQEDLFRLDARGGMALGLGASYQFSPLLGLEARLDTADLRVRMTGARFRLTTPLPGPIPDLVNELDLGGGDADLRRIHPVSLNLRAISSGSTRFGASAGVSYLPAFRIAIRPEAVFRAVSPVPFEIAAAEVALEAEALPEDEDEGRIGFNAGAFVQVDVGSRLALQLEGRYFYFRRQTLTWDRPEIDPPLPFIAGAVVDTIADRLRPAEFNPTFFQITGGLSVRF